MKLDGLKKIPFPLPCLRLPTAPAGQPGMHRQASKEREFLTFYVSKPASPELAMEGRYLRSKRRSN